MTCAILLFCPNPDIIWSAEPVKGQSITVAVETESEGGVWLTALGPVHVHRAGCEVELPGRPSLMLALLLARAGATVGVDELTALLWSAEPPANAANMVHRYIGSIRRALEPGLPFRAAGRWLAGVPGGYRLRVAPEQADVPRFRALVARAAGAPDPESALSDWTAALSLWRGRYAHGLTADPPAAFVAMDRERAAAAVTASATARRAGVSGRILPLIREVAEAHPLDETLAAEMVWLLAAEGRTTDASAWYQRIAGDLADQLGVEPGPALETARAQAIGDPFTPAPGQVAGGPVTTAPGTAAGVPAGRTTGLRPAQLPSDLRLFGGRRVEMAALDAAREMFAGAGVVALDGIPGVGKSTLAVHWAHTVAHRFPDGQLFTNLRGYDPSGEPAEPADVLAGFLEALGVPAGEIPATVEARSGLFRTITANQRLLVVLDNARGVDQVRPLLPASPASLVLITGRARLSGLAAHEGAVLIGLDLPEVAEAREVLRHRLAGVGRELRDADLDAVVELCGRLPLALSIVAARAAERPGDLTDVLAELRESADSLDVFDLDMYDDDALCGVRAVFSWSYRQLSPDAARLFRLLPVHTGPDAGLPMLAGLAGLPRRMTARLLRELVRSRLVSESRPGRFTQHDLIAVYAAELAAESMSDAEREAAADRLLDHFTRTLQQLNNRNIHPFHPAIEGTALPGVEPEIFDDVRTGLDWFRTEMDNFDAVVHDAYRRGRRPWRTVHDSFEAHLRSSRVPRWAGVGRPALAAAVASGDRLGEAMLRKLVGNVLALDSREEGTVEYERSLALFERLGDEAGQGAVLIKIAETWSLADDADYRRAVPFYEKAVTLFQAVGHHTAARGALIWLGRCQLELGRTGAGIAALTEALESCLADGRISDAGTIFMHLGQASDRRDAADFLLMANRIYTEVGNRFWAMYTGLMLGTAYLDAGRRDDARAAMHRSAEAYAAIVAEGMYLTHGVRSRMRRLATEFGEPIPV